MRGPHSTLERRANSGALDRWYRKVCLGCCRQRGILSSMRSQVSRAIVTLILITCLVCPLVELFDNWDHTIQTGNDTEYTFVVLALCVGVTYSFACFIFRCSLSAYLARNDLTSWVQTPFLWTPCSFALLLFDATSPPTLPLRI